jgi:hypothetical protein
MTRSRARLGRVAAVVLLSLAQLTAAGAYAAAGLATVWGPAPGRWSAALSAGGRIHGVGALAVGATELCAAVALCDADLAASSSAVLGVAMLGAVAGCALLGAPVGGAASLLAGAAAVAWVTRREWDVSAPAPPPRSYTSDRLVAVPRSANGPGSAAASRASAKRGSTGPNATPNGTRDTAAC